MAELTVKIFKWIGIDFNALSFHLELMQGHFFLLSLHTYEFFINDQLLHKFNRFYFGNNDYSELLSSLKIGYVRDNGVWVHLLQGR